MRKSALLKTAHFLSKKLKLSWFVDRMFVDSVAKLPCKFIEMMLNISSCRNPALRV
jgi:hypothetical protein